MKLKDKMLFIFLLFFLSISYAQLSFTPRSVYGQTSMTASGPVTPVTASTLYGAGGCAKDSKGNFYVSDVRNNRVLRYPPGSTQADMVYGQDTFTQNVAPTTRTNKNFLYPGDLAIDSVDRLYVTDSQGNRVLRFPFGQNTADFVYGQQGSFTTSAANNGGAISGSGLSFPSSITINKALDSVYILDMGNARMLVFSNNSNAAAFVYGQANFNTGTIPSSPTNSNFKDVYQIVFPTYGGGVWMADSAFNRITFYSTASSTHIRLYGQTTYTSMAGSDTRGIAFNTLLNPEGVEEWGTAADPKILISDTGNNRILYFEGNPPTFSRVYGQSLTTTGAANQGGLSTGLQTPQRLFVGEKDSTAPSFSISDFSNNRVIYFDSKSPTTTTNNPSNPTTTPGNNSSSNVCYHHSSNLQFTPESASFTLDLLQKFPQSYKDCRIAHTVQSKGIEVFFEEGLSLKVTKNHLVAYRKEYSRVNLYVRAIELKKTHRVVCQSQKGWCTVKKIVKNDQVETYFGLNCIDSVLFSDGILTSTFENYHYFPSAWMKIVGSLFGIQKASRWGDSIVEWAFSKGILQ